MINILSGILKSATLVLLLSLAACRPEVPIPKPRAYPKVDTPDQHSYQSFSRTEFPYSFEFSQFAIITQDSTLFKDNIENPYWINIVYPKIGATMFLSYKHINGRNDIQKLLEDAHFMSYYHTKRADYAKDINFTNPNGVAGYMYEWMGDAASKYQFVATDSNTHFIRGALYFDCSPNADSLKPLNDYLRKDIEHLLYTLKWQ